ncbi:hypothetical protein IWZ01DRAFT_507013 [Phyllosticta capitalensis]
MLPQILVERQRLPLLISASLTHQPSAAAALYLCVPAATDATHAALQLPHRHLHHLIYLLLREYGRWDFADADASIHKPSVVAVSTSPPSTKQTDKLLSAFSEFPSGSTTHMPTVAQKPCPAQTNTTCSRQAVVVARSGQDAVVDLLSPYPSITIFFV